MFIAIRGTTHSKRMVKAARRIAVCRLCARAETHIPAARAKNTESSNAREVRTNWPPLTPPARATRPKAGKKPTSA